MSLNDMPSELVEEVLKQITNPADLIRAINSSPVFLRVFNAYPKQIVAPLLTRIMHPEVLHHALALGHFNSSKKQKGPPKGEIPSTDNSKQSSKGSTTKRQQFDFPSDKESLLAMLYTHVHIEEFTENYRVKISEYYSTIARQGKKIKLSSSWLKWLEPSERARFHRAFYRFELYCQINPSRHGKDYDLAPPQGYLRYGFNTLTPWEKTEMLCIHRYFVGCAKSYMIKLNEQFVKAVYKTRRSEAMNAAESQSNQYLPASELFKRLDEWSDNPWFTYNPKHDKPVAKWSDFAIVRMGWAELKHNDTRNLLATFLAMKGLRFMMKVTNADSAERIALQRANKPHTRDFLQELQKFGHVNFRSIVSEDLWDSLNKGNKLPWRDVLSPEELEDLDSQPGVARVIPWGDQPYGYHQAWPFLWEWRSDYFSQERIYADPRYLLATVFFDKERLAKRDSLDAWRVLKRAQHLELNTAYFDEKDEESWRWNVGDQIREWDLAGEEFLAGEFEKKVKEFR